MAEGRKRLTRALGDVLGKKQDKPVLFPAILGAYVDGIAQIKVIGRADFVWCRMRGSTSEVVQAINESVGEHWDLPILIYRDPLNPAFWKIYGRDISQYASWEGASYLPPHGDAHSFSASDRTGVDPVWVFKRQYMPLLPHPIISGANGIYVEPDFYYWGGRYYWWPGSGTASLLGNRPTGALNGAFVTVYLDGPSKTLQAIKGEEFPAWYPPDDASAFITLPSPTQGIPIAAVFLTTGSTRIGWGEIYDLRMPGEALADQYSTGSIVLRNESAILGAVTTLDFVGSVVDASISGTYGRIFITGSAGGGGTAVLGPGTGSSYYTQVGLAVDEGADVWHVPNPPFVTGSLIVFVNGLAQRIGVDYIEVNPESGTYQYLSSPPTGASHLALWAKLVEGGAIASGTVQVWDEGIPLGSFNTLEFVGESVVVTASGTHARIFITGSASTPVTGSVVGLDEGRTLGSFTRLNFRGPGVLASASGSYLDVNVPGPGVDQIGVMVWDEGIPAGSGTVLDFVGAGVTATRSGTVVAISIPGGGGGGGVDQIGVYGLDEGVALGSGTWLDFVGAGVQATLSGTVLTITIPGGAGVTPITGTVVGLAQGQTLGSFDRLNFRGPGVVATASGTYLDVNVVAPGVDQIGVYVTDDGVPIGTGTRLDLGAGLAATLSGTVIRIEASVTSMPVTGSLVLRDEAVVLGSVDTLNFEGPGVSASRSGTYATIIVPGPGVDQIGVYVTDDGVPIGTGTRLDVGDGLTATLSGTTVLLTTVATALPVTGTFVLRDEAVVLGSVDTLDFQGPGVSATRSGTYGTISIPGPGVDQIGVMVWDEGVPIGTGTVLDFVGASTTITLSGTVIAVTITAGQGAASFPGVFGLDEGIPLGTGTWMDFTGDGVVATLSGTVLRVHVGAAGYTPRAGNCSNLAGDYWKVTDYPYFTGSLMVFLNGVAQRPGTDFTESIPASGVFQFTSTPATGSVVVATWGKP